MPKRQRKLVDIPKPRPAPERCDGGILSLANAIDRRISAMVFRLNDERGVKEDFGSEKSKVDMKTERRACIVEEATTPITAYYRVFQA